MKKNIIKIIIIILIIIAIFCIYKQIRKKNIINIVNKENYSFQYDNTWKIEKQNELEIQLVHKKSNSELEIKIDELETEMQYKTIDEIFDSFLYNVQNQNENYKLIYKEKAKITNQNIDGYKILFENEEKQVAIVLYKQGDKLISFIYEAKYEYFDMLLDSVNGIIYSFKAKEQKFDVKSYINLETQEIEYTKQPEVSNILENAKDCQISSNNYLVEYSIPDNFKLTDYDSKKGIYKFDIDEKKKIELTTYIYNVSIYQYLDKEKTGSNIYLNNMNIENLYAPGSITNNLHETEDENEHELNGNGALGKFGEKPLSYIYIDRYEGINLSDITTLNNNELIRIAYELNKNHIFVVELNSENIGIPKELIDAIKIKNIKNVASNIINKKENGFLVGELKQFTDNTYQSTEEIILKLPENYKEIDLENNYYQKRYYISNYYEKIHVPEYEVEYGIVNSIDSELKSINSGINKNLGKYKKSSKIKDITANGKKFEAYEMGKTETSDGLVSKGIYKYYSEKRLLFYKLESGKYLFIGISANEHKINDKIINKLLNFDIKVH